MSPARERVRCESVAAHRALPEPEYGRPLEGRLLLDPDWIGDRIVDTARRWGSADPRVCATLWWYSASSVLTAAGTSALLATDRAPDVHPHSLQIVLRATGHIGYLDTVLSSRVLEPGPVAYGQALAAGFAPIIEVLADVGGASRRSLWAVAADSLAGRILQATESTAPAGIPERIAELVRQIVVATDGLMPMPRYALAQGRPYVRRTSCCLIYQAPRHDTCLSCPRQRPADRAARLNAWATQPH